MNEKLCAWSKNLVLFPFCRVTSMVVRFVLRFLTQKVHAWQSRRGVYWGHSGHGSRPVSRRFHGSDKTLHHNFHMAHDSGKAALDSVATGLVGRWCNCSRTQLQSNCGKLFVAMNQHCLVDRLLSSHSRCKQREINIIHAATCSLSSQNTPHLRAL